MASRIITKIKNQVAKLESLLEQRRVKRFSKKFNSCGKGFYVKFPVCLEGQEHITIGKNVGIAAFVHMWGHGGISIGNDCLIASHVSINSVTHSPDAGLYRESIVEKEIKIGNNVWIGAHAVILPGVVIGNNAVIGASAVVNRDVPADTIVAGVPAKVIRYLKKD